MKTFSKKIILIPAVLLLTFLCGCAAFFGDPNLSSERAAEAIGKALTAWDATDKQALDVHTELTRPAVITETEDLHLQFSGLRSESPLIAVQEPFPAEMQCALPRRSMQTELCTARRMKPYSPVHTRITWHG